MRVRFVSESLLYQSGGILIFGYARQGGLGFHFMLISTRAIRDFMSVDWLAGNGGAAWCGVYPGDCPSPVNLLDRQRVVSGKLYDPADATAI